MTNATMSNIKINLNKEILPYSNTSDEPKSLNIDRLVDLNAENYQDNKNKNYLYKQRDYLSLAGLILAFLAPPLGIIVSYFARRRAINSYKSTFLATSSLVAAVFLSLVLLAFLGFGISRNFERTLDSQDSIKTPGANPTDTNDTAKYSADEKNALDQTNKFLNAIREENYKLAYSLLGPELKKEYKQAEAGFESEIKSANLKLIDSWDIKSVSTNNKGDRFTLKGNAKFKGATPSANLEFAFYKANDGSVKMFLWQISPNT